MKLNSTKAKLLGAVSVVGLIFGTPAALATLTHSSSVPSINEVSTTSVGSLSTPAVSPSSEPVTNVVSVGATATIDSTIPGSTPSPSAGLPLTLGNSLESTSAESNTSDEETAIQSDESDLSDTADLNSNNQDQNLDDSGNSADIQLTVQTANNQDEND